MTKFYINDVEGYIYDKRIFWAGMLLVVSVMLYIFARNDFNFGTQFYFKCEGIQPCLNPMHDGKAYNAITGHEYKCTDEWCYKEYLKPGEYGKQKPGFFTGFLIFAVCTPIAMLGINHLLHNNGKQFKFPSSLSKESREKIKKWYGKIED